MKRLSRVFSFLVLVVAWPALAQSNPAPVITSIDPRAGSMDGGTSVTIRGANLSLPPNFACILPCPTKVFFGGVEGTTLDERDASITVKSPAHVAGTVDIELRTGDGRSITAPDAFTFAASTNPGYEALLLPVYLDGTVSGANGSRWTTEFWIRNYGSAPVQLAPWDCPVGEACPAVFPLTRTLSQGETIRNLPAFFRPPTANTGRLLYVTEGGAGQLATSLRLAEESRAAVDAGTEIPVVREEDFRTSTAYLTSVPLNGSFRLMLRIFEMAQTEARFQVRIYEQFEGMGVQLPLREVELVATTTESGQFRIAPAYAQYAGIGTLLDNPVPRPALLRIEVEPLTRGSVFWPLITITNNDTQRTTLVTPQ
jgi:hypothetical protein